MQGTVCVEEPGVCFCDKESIIFSYLKGMMKCSPQVIKSLLNTEINELK